MPRNRRKPAILRGAMSRNPPVSGAKPHHNRRKTVRTSVTLTSVQAAFLGLHAEALAISARTNEMYGFEC